MTAFTQTLTSLRHRPGRALLTALGTALGIGTIVALLAVSAGATQTAGKFVHLGPGEMGLFQKDASDPTTSVLPESLITTLRRQSWVASAQGLVLLIDALPKAPGAVLFGAVPNGFETGRMVFLSGRAYRAPNEMVVGTTLAQQMGVHLGQTLTVAHRRLHVVGIYHIGIAEQDQGAFIPLATAQAITGHTGEVTTIAVKVSVGMKLPAAERLLKRRFPGLTVITDPDEALRAGANGQLIQNMTLVIVVLALLIGGIGVMNTMLMSVIERRTEFALLSAVGWSGPQVATLVLTEGMALSILGAALGVVIGWLGAQLLVHALGAAAFVSPKVTAWVFGRALLIGILIGVLGGLYPAWRAAHLSPARTLAQH
ncbi:MAG TPA: ABC transporter permease [Solirubrobacteraceae bacterium]|nr:ABC transporter permease [Solirubrobacteraceae bacterium]